MKKILKLSGIQKLSKDEQRDIKGAFGSRPYCDGPKRCCVNLPNGGRFCDFGYCLPNGCMWA